MNILEKFGFGASAEKEPEEQSDAEFLAQAAENTVVEELPAEEIVMEGGVPLNDEGEEDAAKEA